MLRLFAQYLDRPRERRGGRVMARCREAQIMAKRTIRRQRLAVHAAVRAQRRDILARVSDPVSGERSEIILPRLERRAHLSGLRGGLETGCGLVALVVVTADQRVGVVPHSGNVL